MSQNTSFLDLITIHNRFPDCVNIDIEALSLDSQQENSEFDLYLKLNINEQWENILDGKVKFAIKGGIFQLNLNNCCISPSSRLQDKIFDDTQTVSDDLSSIIVKSKDITTTNDTEVLKWSFSSSWEELILKGIYKDIYLGRVKINDESANITANFIVSPQDIYLTDAQGLWKHDLTPNKHSILDRVLAKFLMNNYLQSSLSNIHLGAKINDNQLLSSPSEEFNSDNLKSILEKIINANTDDFLDLAKIANLNPKIDFAGANLTATNLKGLDFSKSNFFRANFRGADLTDIDLSESNLEGVKLNGVDLSGAYLANINLKQSYCYNASFALCNLIGANLSYANLVNANLDNANLTDAQIEGTKFE